ncbi:MAG: hypothetical protein WBD18_01155, partial [Phycisphaerae bacterium]
MYPAFSKATISCGNAKWSPNNGVCPWRKKISKIVQKKLDAERREGYRGKSNPFPARDVKATELAFRRFYAARVAVEKSCARVPAISRKPLRRGAQAKMVCRIVS